MQPAQSLSTALWRIIIRRLLARVSMRWASASKSYEHFVQGCDGILAARMERGNLAGHARASVRRVMDFVRVLASLWCRSVPRLESNRPKTAQPVKMQRVI
ncbi:hypothetical protein NXT3_PA00251 (plasmid) [Sinorhizobium fredii]|uniref:Uncharacterized protein n=1 Tax=Rhizobium fredii TaxID=380 RepID=A0A2L0HAL2_RHIFR|nr:hypothetical protein NXT3_PA00251 [Sinorhizobium fredii]